MTRHNKDLYLIYAISFVDLFAVGLTFPLFSNHLRQLGASHLTVGLISSLYSGLQVISGPIIGGWSDVRDRRSVMMITLIICSISYTLIGLTNYIFVIIILRSILGVAKHTQSLSKTVITDLLPIKERAGAFGRSSAFGSLGFIAGPILGGHLSEFPHGFTYVSTCTGALFCINIGLSYCLSNTHPRKNQTILGGVKKELYKSITDMTDINWGALWEIFLLRFLFGLAISMYLSQQSIYLQEQFNLSQRHIGYTISYFSTVGTISAFLMHQITAIFYKDDRNCLQRLVHFFTLMTVCVVCLYLAPNFQIFLIFLAPFSISCTILRVVSMELMLKQAAYSHRGSLSGTSNSIMSIARFITATTTGLIGDVFGEHATMLFSALPPLLGSIVSISLKLKSQGKKAKLS